MEIAGSGARYATRYVSTPEGISVPFQIATAGDRIVAFSIDFGIIIGVTVASFLLAIVTIPTGAAEIGFSIALLVSFLFRNFYFTFLELLWGGSTIGKRIARIRVIARDGGPLTAGSIIARNLTRDLELFLPLAAMIQPSALIAEAPAWGAVLASIWVVIFLFLPLFNRDRMRVGDIIGGTIVVRTPAHILLPDLALDAPRPAYAMHEPVAPMYVFTTEQLELYGIKELQVLEDLLRRWDERSLQVDTLELVCDKIKRKIRWPGDRWQVDTLVFLREFYKAQRARLEHKLLFGKRKESKEQR